MERRELFDIHGSRFEQPPQVHRKIGERRFHEDPGGGIREVLKQLEHLGVRRIGQPADSLYPLAVGRAVLAVCRAGYDRWAARADADLTVYLDAALRALAAGFANPPLRDSEVGRVPEGWSP